MVHEPASTAAERSRNFVRVREEHRREIMEDYLEMIAELERRDVGVRSGDLAERFGVSPATATNHVQRLIAEGLVENRPYQPLVLTDHGRAIAERSRHRHLLVRGFLIALGVDPATAEADAEGIEHHVSQQTLDAFARFIDREGR